VQQALVPILLKLKQRVPKKIL